MNGVGYNNHIQVTNGSLTIQNGAVEVDQEAIKQSNLTTGITHPHPHDVLSGRGNSINSHPGNQYFRSLVKHLKNEYVVTPKPEKPLFAKLIVKHIQALQPPGRFLKKNKGGNFWEDIGNKNAVNKTRQALREDAEKILAMIEKGQRKVTTNVRASMTLKTPPTTLSSGGGILTTSFTQLKQQGDGQGTSMILPQAVPAFSHLTTLPMQGGPMLHGSMTSGMNGSVNGNINGNINGSMAGSMLGSGRRNMHESFHCDPQECIHSNGDGSMTERFNSSMDSLMASAPVQSGLSSQQQHLEAVQEMNISMEPLPLESINNEEGHNSHNTLYDLIDITLLYDDDMEDFPGEQEDSSYHSDEREDFPGSSGSSRNYSTQPSDYGSEKEIFTGESTKNHFKQPAAEFPHGHDGDNYKISTSINAGVEPFANPDENIVMNDGVSSFYGLDGDRIKLRPSFVNIHKHIPPPPSRTRHSLYHPDLESCSNFDRRRSSMIASKLLEQLQKLDEAIDEDSESEEEQNRDFRPKRKLSTTEAIAHFRGSLRQSLKLDDLDDIFCPRPKRVDRRRSTRISLLLRHSLISSWANATEEVQGNGKKAAIKGCVDLFNSKEDRRRSAITESSNDLLKKVFGNEKTDIPPGCEKDILKEILDPHSTDVLMTSMLSVTTLDESLALLRAEYDDEDDDELVEEDPNSKESLNSNVETGVMNLKV